MRDGGGRKRMGRELSSSVNKLACVHIDEFGWLDNKDLNIEPL